MLLSAVVVLLGAFDVGLTWHGLRLGVFCEANPLLASLLEHSMSGAFAAALAVPALAVLFIQRTGSRIRWARFVLPGLVAVRLIVLGLHVPWLLALR